MSPVWIVSMVLAWVVIALLTVAVVTLLRRVGELSALLGPAAPPVVAADLYDEVAPVEVPTLGGEPLRLAGPLLLVAHQPGCATCGDIEPALAALAAEEPGRVVSVLALPAAAAARHRSPAGVPTVALADLPAALQPRAIPALVGISREGAVCAVGQAGTLAELREAAAATAGADMVSGGRRAMTWGACAPYWTPAGAR